MSNDAKEYLTSQRWTGNVRELENLIHRALVMSDDEVIDSSLLQQIHGASQLPEFVERRATPPLHIALRSPDGFFKTMEEIETEVLRMLLNHFEHNITRAADTLGIAKSTFYRKIKDKT